MKIKDLLNNPKTKSLPPNEFKTYCLLIDKAVKNEIIDFTIRGFLRELQENEESLGMPTGKNTIKEILRTLEDKNLIKIDMNSKKLIML